MRRSTGPRARSTTARVPWARSVGPVVGWSSAGFGPQRCCRGAPRGPLLACKRRHATLGTRIREEAAIESQVAVRMAGVTRTFNDTIAVEDLDLEIPNGSVVGVIGPSGSGKTTTIRMITGSLGPTKGRVEVLGDNPGSFRRQTRERIGYMPQLFSLYP